MKVFRFFLSRVFLSKPILVACVLLLLFMANYIAFSTARTIVSTQEGAAEMARLDANGTFIANLDPDSDIDPSGISDESLQEVYGLLGRKYEYALFTDGYISSLPNSQGVEVPVSYLNQRYDELNGFAISEGSGLHFDHDPARGDVISALVGKGLAKDYPVGSEFNFNDPALGGEVKLKVVGVLAENSAHSNFYAYDSKQYYNFSLVLPVNDRFIESAGLSFKLNGLMDLIVTNTDTVGVAEIRSYMNRATGAKFNFFSQKENVEYYNEYFGSSMRILAIVSVVLLAVIVALSVWTSLVSVRMMVREFTINLLVGLDFSRLTRLVFAFFGAMSFIALFGIFAVASYSRATFWHKGDVSFMTYGFAGLIPMDWLALLAAFIFDALLVFLIAQVVTWRLKRIPISVGVLQ